MDVSRAHKHQTPLHQFCFYFIFLFAVHTVVSQIIMQNSYIRQLRVAQS